MVFFSYIDIFSIKKRKNLYMPTNYVQIQREREREDIQSYFEKIEYAKEINEVIDYQKAIFDLCRTCRKELTQNYDYNNVELDYLKEYESFWQKNQDNLDRLAENIEKTLSKLRNESNILSLYG